MTALLVVAALMFSTPDNKRDRCAPLVKPALAKMLGAAYPGYRLPRETDQDVYNVAYNLKHGGSGCLGIARGDYDGDQSRDVALLLAAKDRPETLVVVALRRGQKWLIERLETWDQPISSCYVDVVPAGTYESPFAGESPQLPNQLPAITSATQGVAAGQLESTALYYFRKKGTWRFVWMSD